MHPIYAQRAAPLCLVLVRCRAFTKLDVDKDGVLCVDEIIAALRTKLPPTEIRAAVELAMREAGHGPASAGMEFVDFMRMLKVWT